VVILKLTVKVEENSMLLPRLPAGMLVAIARNFPSRQKSLRMD